MSRILLVRHGETVWHKENRYAGRSDVALTVRGQAQADQLAAWAVTARITAVWSSPCLALRRQPLLLQRLSVCRSKRMND